MENLTEEERLYLKELKELIYKLNKGHLTLPINNNEVKIDNYLSK